MNLFKRKKKTEQPQITPEITEQEIAPTEAEPVEAAQTISEEQPDDGFDEWFRTPTRGGIERRERNDIYEEYRIYGADKDGKLTCRRYHRYPEHEREFDLSYSRALSFEEFNRRLLEELDKGDMKLGDYNRCITAAERLSNIDDSAAVSDALSDEDKRILELFCDGMDTLTNRSYLHNEGTLSCECESVVGNERLQIRFRKPLKYDALDTDVGGVSRKPIEGYDIENLWIMSIFNRLRERTTSCKANLLTSEWSINHESIHLFLAEGFEGIGGALMIAVGSPDDMSRLGFWSLDFSAK
ncbi:MAG: hypothetical protein IJ639_00290 [Ruminococcus sp.]|nr:hypothetical protein [Ruminococcus sp.]